MLLGQAAGGPVDGIRADQVRLFVQKGHIDRGHGPHAGGCGDAPEAMLQFGHGFLQRFRRRILNAGVDVPFAFSFEQFGPMPGALKREGRGLIDGDRQRSQRILSHACVHHLCVESCLLAFHRFSFQRSCGEG